tara:strand:- start:6000 stop:6470 length:471 start_codon:yes stop_codon:yes gene_type:complete
MALLGKLLWATASAAVKFRGKKQAIGFKSQAAIKGQQLAALQAMRTKRNFYQQYRLRKGAALNIGANIGAELGSSRTQGLLASLTTQAYTSMEDMNQQVSLSRGMEQDLRAAQSAINRGQSLSNVMSFMEGVPKFLDNFEVGSTTDENTIPKPGDI